MNKIDIKQHIILFFLAIIIILQIKFELINMFLVIIPIIILSISIQIKNKNIGIIGILLFYLITLPQIIINTMENIQLVLIELVLLIIPSIFLLSQIMQIENKEITLFKYENKKTIILIFILLTIILFIFYTLSIFIGEGLILSMEKIEGQIFLLTAISLSICIPLIIK
jgi:hypothetical protein